MGLYSHCPLCVSSQPVLICTRSQVSPSVSASKRSPSSLTFFLPSFFSCKNQSPERGTAETGQDLRHRALMYRIPAGGAPGPEQQALRALTSPTRQAGWHPKLFVCLWRTQKPENKHLDSAEFLPLSLSSPQGLGAGARTYLGSSTHMLTQSHTHQDWVIRSQGSLGENASSQNLRPSV